MEVLLIAAPSVSQRSFPMTVLRQRMIEYMQIRNLSRNTQESYLQQVTLFARHFNKSPDLLDRDDIRNYQIHLTNEKKLAPGSIHIAPRCYCCASLPLQDYAQERMDLRRGHSASKEAAETAHRSEPRRGCSFSWLRRKQESPRHPDDMLCRRFTHLGGRAPDVDCDRQPTNDYPCGTR